MWLRKWRRNKNGHVYYPSYGGTQKEKNVGRGMGCTDVLYLHTDKKKKKKRKPSYITSEATTVAVLNRRLLSGHL